MPGRSRCAVVLTEEERSELERRAARYTLPRKQVQRAKLILYAAEGLTNVARRCRWGSRSTSSSSARTSRDGATKSYL